MNSCKRRLLKLFRGLFRFQDRLTYASVWGRSQYHGNGWHRSGRSGFLQTVDAVGRLGWRG